ncbi:MAG: orotidine-5'-phosphate decarboxylase [Acidimicrobiia bacterium]
MIPSQDSAVSARDRMVLALDVGGLDEALAIAQRLAPWFATVKVGSELYAESGPRAIDALQDLGFQIFLDLKLHDIPNTVERAARAHARRGLAFCTFHACGGVAMLQAGIAGLEQGARDAGVAAPVALGVTVLTSDIDTSPFGERLSWAAKAGCGGVVCSGQELPEIRRDYPMLGTMVPGVRLAGGEAGDQARVATPDGVIAAGGDWLVIGRAVTGASDPEAAATEVSALIARAIR